MYLYRSFYVLENPRLLKLQYISTIYVMAIEGTPCNINSGIKLRQIKIRTKLINLVQNFVFECINENRPEKNN